MFFVMSCRLRLGALMPLHLVYGSDLTFLYIPETLEECLLSIHYPTSWVTDSPTFVHKSPYVFVVVFFYIPSKISPIYVPCPWLYH